jgi:hypothetical protein
MTTDTDITTLVKLEENLLDDIFVSSADVPHREQPLRKQEAQDRTTLVIVFHDDGSQTFYARMPWVQVHEQPVE